jgi:hypothetical protein
MSLKFPISLVGKRGGIDLKEGLVRWWEDGDRFDKVTGTAKIGVLRGSKTLAPPSPFVDTFDPSRDGPSITAHMNNPATDFTSYTIFALAGRKETSGYRNWAGTSSSNAGDNIKESTNNRINVSASSSSFRTPSHTNQQWNTFVFSKSGLTMEVYKDGVLIYTITGTSNPYTSWWRCWDCQKTSFAIWGRANIPWTQEHVDVFHNGGSYVQYENL